MPQQASPKKKGFEGATQSGKLGSKWGLAVIACRSAKAIFYRRLTGEPTTMNTSKQVSKHSVGSAAALYLALPLTASAETPLTADGHPNLSGTWDNGSGIDWVAPVQIGESICVTGCDANPRSPSTGDRPTYKLEYMAKVQDLEARQVEEDPVMHCRAPGLPRIGPPDKIVQTPSEIIFLYDDYTGNYFRVVPMDGRPHRTDVEPSALGDSIGWWEDDALVVETVSFNDETWLTDDGSFHTTDLRVIERLTRDEDTLEWRATAHDPEILQEPWELVPRIAQLTDLEITEAAPCLERDMSIRVNDTHHDNLR